MRYAIVKNGIVENVIEAESPDFMPGLIACDDDGGPGDLWDGVKFSRVESKSTARSELVSKLAALDMASARPSREIAAAIAGGKTAPAFAVSKLATIESQAAALRAELAGLNG